MTTRRRCAWLAAAVLAAGGAGGAEPAHEPVHEHVHAPEPAEPLPGGSLYQLGVTVDPSTGGRLALESLRGTPVVVTMFYASCTTVCPMLTLAMQRIAAGLDDAERARLRLVMVSFDDARDTPARLAEFATEHHLATPPFIVAHATAGDVRAIAAALGIRYRQLPDQSFSHASLITLLDRDGVPLARTQVLAAEDPGFVATVRAALK